MADGWTEYPSSALRPLLAWGPLEGTQQGAQGQVGMWQWSCREGIYNLYGI